jgi:hypothetical protein
MSKEDNPDMKVLKNATCKTLSAKSTLTYQVGIQDDEIHIRISKNTGGGFFSNEWISMDDIRSVLDEHPAGTPVTSFILQPLFRGKSVNTPAFLLAALASEKLLRPMKGKKRSHEPVESDEFTAMVKKLTASSTSAKKKVTTKRPTKKAVTKKAVVKKRAAARKKATTRSPGIKKASLDN